MDKRDNGGITQAHFVFTLHQTTLLAELARQAPYDIAAKILAVLQQGQQVGADKQSG